uniref:Uncharacterized protein n=1 Tax=Helicotheca tamesis TaxID=374047 RepID=A0A7S2I364_9STRA|mmetsp:Transcript_486/g.621  ORF Transcript_486/g.621 Transcript_486/m.621 type:complete len:366 (+) Transcript_486:22-1119(+)
MTSTLSTPNDSSNPSTLTNLICNRNLPCDKIISRIQSNPNEAKNIDSNGYTPLHHILKHRDAAAAPIEMYRLLLDVYPGAAGKTTKTGQTPLALACWRRVPLEVLSILAEACPKAARIPDGKGVYPLVALWKSYVMYFGGNDDYVHVIFATCSEEWKRGCWDMFDLLLRLTYQGTTARDNDGGSLCNVRYQTLHAAAGIPWCPPALTRLAIRHHRHQLQVMDNNGRLPLSITAASNMSSFTSNDYMEQTEQSKDGRFSSNDRTPSDGIDLDQRKNKDDNLNILTKAYPHAACIPDDDGRLALHMALESGKPSWKESVKDLALAAPEAMQSRDAVTFLYPYQLAAIHGNKTAAFELLVACPHVLLS